MNIDTGTIITAILFLLVCSIPFILLGRNARKKEKQFANRLIALAQKNSSSISQYSFWGHAAIGIDEKAGMVYFAAKPGQGNEQQLRLDDYQKCRIIKTGNTGNSNDKVDIAEKLELAFTPKDKDKKETSLTFFDASHHGAMLTGELQVAEKWCRIINEKLK